MRPAADALVIGDALLDVTVTPEAEPRRGADVPAAMRVAPGGQGANIAVRLARRGLVVRLACALGDDAAGTVVRDALLAEGVGLEAAPAVETGIVVILLAPDGERTMYSRRVPLLPLGVDTTAAWTVISGYPLLEDGDLRLTDRGGRLAVIGCALPEGDASDWWLRAHELLPDLVVMNADEARMVGADARTLALEAGAVAVVTQADGAQAAFPHPDMHVRRVRVETVPGNDTTGAGDAFAAALLAELHHQPWPPSATALDGALANAAGFAAQVARVPGAQARVAAEGPA